jgi:environmental stress-induced protein Ves
MDLAPSSTFRMMKRIVKKSEYRQMRWANGGGLTDELFVHCDPDSGRLLWRMSMADVSLDGPFSQFDGYDRILVLLSGRGLNLRFDGGNAVDLGEIYDQVSFYGDVATYATLRAGPIKDFNLIVDRKTFGASVSILRESDNLLVPENVETLAVLAMENDVVVTEPCKQDNSIPRGDLFIAQKPKPGEWNFDGATSIVALLVRRDDG